MIVSEESGARARAFPSNFGEGVVPQGIDPLLTVPGILPRWHPVNMHLTRHLFKGWHFLPRIKTWVQPLLGHAAIFQRPFTRLVERHDIRPTQTKVSAQGCAFSVLLAFDHHPHDPTPSAGRINHQIQAVTIAMTPSAQRSALRFSTIFFVSLPDRAISKYHISDHSRNEYRHNRKKLKANEKSG